MSAFFIVHQDTHDDKHRIRIEVYSSKETGVISVDGSKVMYKANIVFV